MKGNRLVRKSLWSAWERSRADGPVIPCAKGEVLQPNKPLGKSCAYVEQNCSNDVRATQTRTSALKMPVDWCKQNAKRLRHGEGVPQKHC